MAAEPAGVDLARLGRYLDSALGGLDGPLAAELIAGGRSNLTYRLTDGRRRWVLRRPPLAHVLPTAHDMAREFRVIGALARTTVPVPEAVHLCTDPEVVGAPFYLMAEVDGVVLRGRREYATVPPGAGAPIGAALVDVLADLHEVDPAAVGLADFGRPEGYLARQVARWWRQWEGSATRDLPVVAEVRDELARRLPASTATGIVHGDYRLDNVMLDASHERVVAVLDWEMATLGDPLTDVGMLFVYTDLVDRGTSPLTPTPDPALGFPGAHALLERYAERREVDLDGIDWYVAFGYFKLAVICEGVHARFLQGKTVGTGFDRIGSVVPALVDLAAQTLRET
jgi:aminoglycoside phosphotransferase (APT) family kinase protein